MKNKWIETKPFEMEDDVKKLMTTLKDMKCDKKANAYIGIMDEIKNDLSLGMDSLYRVKLKE